MIEASVEELSPVAVLTELFISALGALLTRAETFFP